MREHRWGDFCIRREELKETFPPKEAFERALADFPPLANGEIVAPEAEEESSRVSKTMFLGKTCSTQQSVIWVAKHIAVEDAIASEAPSSEAWGMLIWAQRTGHNEREFWTSIYPKLLPTRTQLDAEARFSDDGRAIISIIERVRSAALHAKAGTDDGEVQPLRLDQRTSKTAM